MVKSTGILDSELADILNLKTTNINYVRKRSFSNCDDSVFGHQMDPVDFKKFTKRNKQWGGRRKPPFIYNFNGVSLLISRLRLNLSEKQSAVLKKTFNEDSFRLADYGYRRIEETYVSKIKTALDGIVEVKIHHYITVGDNKYFIDVYLPKHNIAIEIDEANHKYRANEDMIRERVIKKHLKCDFVRINENEQIEVGINKILKAITKSLFSEMTR